MPHRVKGACQFAGVSGICYHVGMRKMALVAALLTGFASAAETWTLATPRTWSRDKDAIRLSNMPDGSFEVRHTGEHDWCVNGFSRIAVVHGDMFEMSCETDALPDMPNSRPVGVSVILRNANGEVVSWTYASFNDKPGRSLRSVFMVPRGGATIEPRVTGGGVAGARVRNLKVVRTGNARPPAAQGAPECTFSNAMLKGTISAVGISVTDLRTGRTWAPPGSKKSMLEEIERRQDADGTIHIVFVRPDTMQKRHVTCRLEKERPEVLVTIGGDGPMTSIIAYPEAFATRKGDRLIVPMNEGISYPADEPDKIPGRLIAYGGHGICMAFFGVQDDATGAGWMAILETADDVAMEARRDQVTGLWGIGPSWESQKGRFGYVRRIRYVVIERGGYVAMCKRYRAYAKEIGKFKPFSEKVKERPLVDRLLGAPNVWCWEKDKIAVAKELKAAGIDRFLWSSGGTSEQVAYMAKMPDVLVSRYDVYQDIYHPDQLKKLGWKSGSNTEAWPRDIVWNSADSNDWRQAWGVKTKDGEWTYCAMMCDSVAPEYERRNVTEELKTKPYNTRFIDTTVAAPWQTCWNPAHPMTRSDSRHWKMELLRILGDEFRLVVGSETGHDASVPFCDYYEGMLSLGPYRVPDSGRNISQVWTNVPPRVAKYQVGEAYRLPLWELVYHECVCANWYWGDYNNKLPDIWWKRDLFNMLYGTMGMYIFNSRQWAADKEKFVRSYRLTSPIARATGYSEMTDHRILSPDRRVQESRFADGTTVTVNFGTQPFALADGTSLPAGGHRVRLGQR